MPWNNLPATESTDWTHIDFLNQFVDAYNERADLIIGVGGIPNWLIDPDGLLFLSVEKINTQYAEGDHPAKLSTVAHPTLLEIQTRLEILCHYFGDPSLFPVGQQVDIDHTTAHEGLFNEADWRDAAGIPTDGYTRKFPREIDLVSDPGTNGERARLTTDAQIYDHSEGAWQLSEDQGSPVDTVTAYGLMEAGDYIGPWIFNELQAGIQALDKIRFPVRNTRVFTNSVTQHWGDFHTGNYVAELSPGNPDLEGMSADAYAGAVWSENPLAGTHDGVKLSYVKVLPDVVNGGVRSSRHRFRATFADLGLGFIGFWDGAGLTRDIIKLYMYPKTSGVAPVVFYDFGTGLAESWNDITGDYDPEMPASGQDWDASEAWPFAIDQTVKPADPVAALGWFDTAYVSVFYEMPYDQFAGYIQYSGFDFP